MIAKKLEGNPSVAELKEEYSHILRAYRAACDQVGIEVPKNLGRSGLAKEKQQKRNSLVYRKANQAYEDFVEKINRLPKQIQNDFWSSVGV